ncbi:MAG TPA: aldehyde oxidase [Thermotogae bacterium]|nr:aldehyde oxidase [Thermotogota bacterium]
MKLSTGGSVQTDIKGRISEPVERTFDVVGRPVKKIDSMGMILGEPVYTDDMAPSNVLIVKILRSPHAHAVIKRINKDKALKVPGVKLILTHEDVPRVPFTRAGQGYPEPSPYDTFLLDRKVRYVGDAVAIVAGETEEAVDEALRQIEVEYEVLEPVLDFEHAMDEGMPVIHDEPDIKGVYNPSRNIAAHYEMSVGDVEEVLKNCEIVVEGTYYYPRSQHVMMEPHAAFSYLDSNGRLVVVSSTQVPFHTRRILSRIFSIPIGKIRVIKPRIGGGFGAKQAMIVDAYIAAVTLKTGLPAKIVYTREEAFVNTYTRHLMRFTVRVGADRNGKIKAIDMKGLSDTGAYGDHALTTFMVAGSKTLPLYNKVEAVRFSGDVVYTNHPSAGAFRGYGAPQGLLALESVVDQLAYELGMDPVEIRKMNAIREGESSPIFKIMGEGREGVEQVVESCKLHECIEKGMEIIGWKEKWNKKRIEGSKVLGVGVSIAMQGSGIAKVDMASATIKMNDDGSFNLLVGATDLGTGSDTVLAQIAAETLGVDVEDIIVYSSDTDMTPFDTGAYASSTTYVSGNAVKKAAEEVKYQILEAAAEFFGEPMDNLHIEKKKVVSKSGKSVTFADLCTTLYYGSDQRQIAATASFVGEVSPPPFMASFAEVAVDTETGEVELRKFVSVADAGKALNPELALGQLYGATVQGLGATFNEELRFDSRGRPVNASLFTYKIPSRGDHYINNIECHLVDSYEPTGPYGAKSIAEIGIDTPAVTVLNAIYNAVGVRLNKVPVNPEELLKKMEEKK